MKDPVIIEPYNDNWPFIYNELRTQIVKNIGKIFEGITRLNVALEGLAA